MSQRLDGAAYDFNPGLGHAPNPHGTALHVLGQILFRKPDLAADLAVRALAAIAPMPQGVG